MNTKQSISCLLLFALFFSQCITQKDNTQKEMSKLLPPVPYYFNQADSLSLVQSWTNGMRFYKSNCAECHGVFGKGKNNIPNFSKQQMDDYKTSFLAGDTLNHAVMAKMTETELSNVFQFITDLKRPIPKPEGK